MAFNTASHQPDPALTDLVTHSSKARFRKSAPTYFSDRAAVSMQLSSSNWSDLLGDSVRQSPLVELSSHAAPLMPLRERDLLALIDLFSAQSMPDIETDIVNNLHNRHPELCWDDDILDLLDTSL